MYRLLIIFGILALFLYCNILPQSEIEKLDGVFINYLNKIDSNSNHYYTISGHKYSRNFIYENNSWTIANNDDSINYDLIYINQDKIISDNKSYMICKFSLHYYDVLN